MPESEGLRHAVYICADRGIPVEGRRGSSAHVRMVTSALAGQGLSLTLVAARTGAFEPFGGVTVVPIGVQPPVARMGDALCASAGRAWGREFLDLARNMELLNKLERLHKRRPVSFVLERLSLFSFAGLRFAHQRKLPYLVEVNAPLVQEQREHRELALEQIARAVEQTVLAEAGGVICVSSALRDHVLASGAKPERIKVLPNAAPPSLLDLPLDSHRAGQPFTVGFVGSLKPWHGLADLVDAFERVVREAPDSRLLVVGDGPERASLEARAAQKGLTDRLEWTGAVPHGQVAAYLARMDVAVAPYPPSKDFYFSPIKIAEYMAAGRAIVASRIGAIADTLEHGRTALLHEPGDVEQMAALIIELKAEAGLRKELAANARAESRQRTWAGTARAVMRLAEECRERMET